MADCLVTRKVARWVVWTENCSVEQTGAPMVDWTVSMWAAQKAGSTVAMLEN